MTFGALHNEVLGSHTQSEWDDLVAAWGWRCYYCASPVCEKSLDPERELTKDHLFPVCRGGEDFISNLIPACFRCNCLKGEMSAEEFLLGRPVFSAAAEFRAAKSTGNTSLRTHADFSTQAARYLSGKLRMEHQTAEYWSARRQFLKNQMAEIRRLQLVADGQLTLSIFGGGSAKKLAQTEASSLALLGINPKEGAA